MPTEIEALWDVRDLCAQLRVGRSTIYDWVHMGYIPYVRIGDCVRFRASDIQEWINQQAKPGRRERIPTGEV